MVISIVAGRSEPLQARLEGGGSCTVERSEQKPQSYQVRCQEEEQTVCQIPWQEVKESYLNVGFEFSLNFYLLGSI